MTNDRQERANGDDHFERAWREALKLAGVLTADPGLPLYVLRCHLHIECLLETILVRILPRADRILDERPPSFYHKLRLVHSFDIVPVSAIKAMERLNALRNKCAHQRSPQITLSDIDKIGRTLGRYYQELRQEHEKAPEDLFVYTCAHICGALSEVAHRIEEEGAAE